MAQRNVSPGLGADASGLLPPEARLQKAKARKGDKDLLATKRRCVSSACTACRKRKSKCDGNLPSCAACASVYGSECVYDPGSDHRRKGVYKKDVDGLKTRSSTLQTLIQGILNYPESEVYDLVKRIRSCENLEDVAEEILARDAALGQNSDVDNASSDENPPSNGAKIEKELSGKMGELRLENGSVRFLGGTSNLLYLESHPATNSESSIMTPDAALREDSVTSWTVVSPDKELIIHLLNMYFTWHYTYFATLSKSLFFRDFFRGKPAGGDPQYCTSLLVNAMLAVGCHFTSWPGSRSDPDDPSTAGDHFFKEAKRLIVANDDFENPRIATVQALALMSVREAGCGREPKGWVYSGMSFRMACDLGLNLGLTGGSGNSGLGEQDVDARRITFWGCFLFDKCWSNYLGRTPQLVISNITTPKFDVFPEEDAETWTPWTDAGSNRSLEQPSRTRAIALQISTLCEISSDLLLTFYRPAQQDKPLTRPAEVKKLSDFHTRLEAWRKGLPKELEPREGQLPNVLLMHMFFHLLFIHLFRPFLKYNQANSPLPPQVSPRKMCTQAAANISKLLRTYKRIYGLQQICNIAVYIAHSACTIHLLNLPDKEAKRDISYGVQHLEEIAGSWLCASRTLATLAVQARRWHIELPAEAATTLHGWETKYRSVHFSPVLGKVSPTIEQAQRVASTKSSKSSPGSSKPSDALFPKPPAFQQPSESQGREEHETKIEAAADLSAPTPVYATQQPSSVYESSQFTIPVMDAAGAGDPTSDLSSSFLPKQPRRPSYSSLFPGLETLFEDSKEWWLRDQSTYFDNWGIKRDSGVGLTGRAATNPAINPFTSASSNPSTMIPTTAHGQGDTGVRPVPVVSQADSDENLYNMGSWDFTAVDPNSAFGFNRQTTY